MIMKYKKLSECAEFSDKRTSDITFENYITTENMLKNKGGIKVASSLPDVKTTSKYEVDDILLSNIRPYFKKIWIANREGSCSNDVLVIKCKENYWPRFIYYVLCDNNFFNYDTVTSKGTKMPRGTPHAIMKYLVPDIDIDKQKGIAEYLFQYDLAIENNNKRIIILEQMAENLYREWFVRFRFPGYEEVEFISGIPKGWKIKKLCDVTNIKAGGDKPDECYECPSEEYNIPVYSNGIDNDGLYGYTNRAVIVDNSITISARGTVGFVCLHRTPFMPIVRLLAITPKLDDNLVYYLFYNLKFDGIIGNGTSQQQITVPMVNKKRVLLPDDILVEKYASIAKEIWDEIDIIKRKNENLIMQRDRLLPRLMSGKLQVK